MLKKMLQAHEGLRLKPYTCTAGRLTIGYGRNLEDTGITAQEAAFLLQGDIDRVTEQLARCFPWTAELDEVRRAVLLDMAFNLGPVGLARFPKFLGFLEAGDYEAASLEMLDSRWASQVGKRAQRLSRMVASGEWPDDL